MPTVVPFVAVTRHCLGIRVRGRNGSEKFRDAEIENLDPFAFGNHDVRRLEVAVQDSRRMSTGKALGNLRSEGQTFSEC